MKPYFPYGMFDLCIVPKHDKPLQKNIIVSFGALNAIPPVEIDLTKNKME